MDTSELEAKLGRKLGGYWHTRLPKPRQTSRSADWSNPSTVAITLSQVEAAMSRATVDLAELQELQDELIHRQRILGDDGRVFFDELLPIDMWELFSDEEAEAFADCGMPTSRHVVEKVGEVLPAIIKGAIIDILSEC